jgi:hypothetical protein
MRTILAMRMAVRSNSLGRLRYIPQRDLVPDGYTVGDATDDGPSGRREPPLRHRALRWLSEDIGTRTYAHGDYASCGVDLSIDLDNVLLPTLCGRSGVDGGNARDGHWAQAIDDTQRTCVGVAVLLARSGERAARRRRGVRGTEAGRSEGASEKRREPHQQL